MNGVPNKIRALAALTLCLPPSLLVLALIGKSSELLILGFLATVVALVINLFLSLGLLVVWFTGVETVTPGKPIRLMLCAGVVSDVVILWLMPPLAK